MKSRYFKIITDGQPGLLVDKSDSKTGRAIIEAFKATGSTVEAISQKDAAKLRREINKRDLKAAS